MVPEIKDFKTWEEVETWLARHGYGLGQIAQIKANWKAPEVVKSVAATKPEVTKAKDEASTSTKK